MKNYSKYFIFIFLILITFSAKDTIMDNDKIIKEIKSKIPKNWKIITDKDMLIFERNGTVWSLFENQISQPMSFETEEERAERIKKYGTKTKTQVIYRYEDKWSSKQLKDAYTNNDAIYKKISGLMDKYKIRHLYDEMLSAKGDEYFIEGTPAENKRIEEYKTEKQKLESQIINIPQYNTEKYSLFLMEGSGYNDSFHIVYPFEASEEAYMIINLVSQKCERI